MPAMSTGSPKCLTILHQSHSFPLRSTMFFMGCLSLVLYFLILASNLKICVYRQILYCSSLRTWVGMNQNVNEMWNSKYTSNQFATLCDILWLEGLATGFYRPQIILLYALISTLGMLSMEYIFSILCILTSHRYSHNSFYYSERRGPNIDPC
jgi:hypothetical protein